MELKALTLLGFDFGTKSIGVAVGQTVTQTARPLIAVKVKDDIPHWQAISDLITEWKPDALVVGMPLNMNGSPQEISYEAENFMRQLKKRYTLPVYQHDERLTSVEARAQLFTAGGYRALKKGDVDAFSAKLILESWMHAQ